jgi:hypothetical protein
MKYNSLLNDIEICIDQRTILLSIIEILSNYSQKYPRLLTTKFGNKEYIEEVKSEFSKFQNSKVIIGFNNLIEKYDLSFSRPIQLILELNENLTFSENEFHPFCLEYNNDIQMISFLKSIYQFSKIINFKTFYIKQSNRFLKYIKNVSLQLNNAKIKEFLNTYYGINIKQKLVVNLIPWRSYGCYGTKTNNYIYAHLCCHHLSTSDVDVYPDDSGIFNYESFLVHEFSHSIINPIVDENYNYDDFEIFENLEQLHEIGYGSNSAILKDYLVRSVTQRYLYLTNNKYYHKQCIDDEQFGFIEMEKFLEFLKNYEQNKNNYINFSNYYQNEIINFLNLKNKIKKI